MSARRDSLEQLPAYNGNDDHLRDELRRLDLLIQLRVAAFRLKNRAAQDAASPQSMYISHGEVDWLLGQDALPIPDQPELWDLHQQLEALEKHIETKEAHSLERGVFLALPTLAGVFGLSSFEIQTIVICLAPELRRKYDKLYAYLQDDVTRKKPSVDLVLDLLCESEADKWHAQAFLSEHASLLRAGIIEKTDDPNNPSGSSGLAQFLRLEPRILDFLLDRNRIDKRLISLVQLRNPSGIDDTLFDPKVKAQLLRLVQRHFSVFDTGKRKLIVYLQGPYGVGKQSLAMTISEQLGGSMLLVDVPLLLAHGSEAPALLKLAFRESLLMQAPLYLHYADALLAEDTKPVLKTLANLMAEYGWLVFLTGEHPWTGRGIFDQHVFHAVQLSVPDVPMRRAVWEKSLSSRFPQAGTWAAELANQFRLTPGQIQDALESVEHARATKGPPQEMTLDDLYLACRQQSNHKLRELAVKIEPRCGWEDIVLPEDQMAHLREICSQVRHSYRVFNDWGFDKKLSRGKGVSALFSGPPGTGKTLAAEVIAHDLELDLYKIDLSSVVSKYIGETEKNLARIFEEAETSNAILFFDEADALFGKRTDVSDAHDRYANIETSYLLQKMEEYEGVVILATNLRENMDDAFIRRIRFIVEFPFPDEDSRLKIWQTHFPKEAPLSEDIDYEYLARELKIAGGSIKNIVLNSAFLAAANGGAITTEHIRHGAEREFAKIGKLWSENDPSPSSRRKS